MIAPLLALLLQVTPVAPIVKGTALPPPASDDTAVMAPIQALLSAIGTGDGNAVLGVTRPEGSATVASEGAQPGVRSFRWADFAARLKPSSDKVEERLGTPAIEVDGNVAMVWAPYTVTVNGQIHHCGYDHFDLVREGGTWKVLNVTWSQRMTGCAA